MRRAIVGQLVLGDPDHLGHRARRQPRPPAPALGDPPHPATPSASKRRRHARTDVSVVSQRRATSLVGTPSAANSSALA